jgi:type IV pilus assembly protein PilF
MIRRLKKAALAACGPLFVLAFVSGCVSSTEGSMESNDEEAAKYNTQLGATYLQRGMLEQAREKLEKAVEQNPDQASARAYLGVLYERIDEEKLAGNQYRAAARLKPKDPFILNTYGGYLCRTDKRREGIDNFVRAAKNPLYQTPAVALTNAGVCAAGIPDYDEANSYLRMALNIDAGYREAMLQLADVSMKRGDPMQARAFVERYLGTGDTSPNALILGMQAETELGNEAAAQEYRRQIMEQFPEYARTL